jgi:uncharacterized protein HemY
LNLLRELESGGALMRLSVAAVIAVLLGAFAAHFLLADRGYVLVNLRGYVVEMSVPGLVIVLVLGYLLVRALVAVVEAPKRWRAAREQRQAARRDSDLAAGSRSSSKATGRAASAR